MECYIGLNISFPGLKAHAQDTVTSCDFEASGYRACYEEVLENEGVSDEIRSQLVNPIVGRQFTGDLILMVSLSAFVGNYDLYCRYD